MANINQSMQEIINELKAKAIYDQKSDLASVIGSPAVGTDSVPLLLNKLQTNKNNLASNLGSKGVTASGTESIESLVGKVGNIITGKKWVSGVSKSGASATVIIPDLPFTPSIIFVSYVAPNTGYEHAGIYFNSFIPSFGGKVLNLSSNTITTLSDQITISGNSVTIKTVIPYAQPNTDVKWYIIE